MGSNARNKTMQLFIGETHIVTHRKDYSEYRGALMSLYDLATILSKMHNNSLPKEKVLIIHLFAAKLRKNLRKWHHLNSQF